MPKRILQLIALKGVGGGGGGKHKILNVQLINNLFTLGTGSKTVSVIGACCT